MDKNEDDTLEGLRKKWQAFKKKEKIKGNKKVTERERILTIQLLKYFWGNRKNF